MDRTTEMLSAFVCDLHYHDLTPQTVHQVKRVLVDTLACAMGGYLSEPAKIARQLASTVKSDGDTWLTHPGHQGVQLTGAGGVCQCSDGALSGLQWI